MLKKNLYKVYSRNIIICVYIKVTMSNATKYRNEHPEYRQKERERYREIESDKYKNDEEYRQKKRERALAYYYKKKALQVQTTSIVSN